MSEKAPKGNSDLVAGEYAQVDQKIYSNGVAHVYGVDPTTGKKRHISHEEILNAYGHSSKEAAQNTADFVLNPAESIDLSEDDIEDQENLDAEWNELIEVFKQAKESGDYTEADKAFLAYQVQLDQSEEAENADLEFLMGVTNDINEESTTGSDVNTALLESIDSPENNEEDASQDTPNTEDEVDTSDETAELLDEIQEEDADVPTSIYHRVRNWWRDRNAQAATAVTLAAMNTAERLKSGDSTDENTDETTDESNEKKRRWVKPVVALGVIAVGFALWKYGIQPKINGETAQVVGDAADQASKLTGKQQALLDATGQWPWDRFADVYGADKASTKLLKAVEHARDAGVEVRTSGSGTSYSVQVLNKHGEWTSNTNVVTKVLATGRSV